MTKLLTTERLGVFSDSVLLVAITILAYNLVPPPIIKGELSDVGVQTFVDNVYGLISSFFMISIFWVLYTKILDYMREPDELVILTSLVFFILVLLTPVFTLAQFQYETLQSVTSLALLQIINGLLLILLWTYLIRHRKRLMAQEEELSATDKRHMYSRLALIPCVYIIAIAIAFFVNLQIATIFPVIIVPAMILLWRIWFRKGEEKTTQV